MTEKPSGATPLPPSVNLVAKTFEDGGKHYTTISITFLLACLYVLITVASTSHQDLLLGATPKLPILDVSIPLQGFYIVAPILILVLHLHLLLQSHVLVKRLRHPRIAELGGDESFFLFPALPVLLEVLKPRESWVARFVWIALWVTNVLLPLVLFCLTQATFLPYHSFWITLCHQVFVVVDLVIAWCFLVVLFPSRERQGIWWRISKLTGGVVTVLVLLYSFVLAVVPGTWIEIWTGKHKLVELVAEVVPRNLEFRGNAKGASLAGRDLRGADLEGADLRKADLRGADLTGAILESADLREANLGPEEVKTPILTQERGVQKVKAIEEEIRKGVFKPARLNNANLKSARLEGASLLLSNLSQADLRKAHLKGVEMTGASLRYVLLQETDLAGVELSLARMEGADLTGAHAEGTTFDHASLSGASLNQADASAASFVSANLEGVRLTEAVLKAANFDGADLVGADFRRASLQGSSSLQLEATDLRGAHLGGICKTSVFGLTDFRAADLEFLSDQEWQKLRQEIGQKLKGRAEGEIEAVLDRIDEAALRKSSMQALINCLGTLLSSPAAQRNLGFLKLDVDRNVIVEEEPAASTWNEAAFHKELAARLLEKTCSSVGLARTITLRAAGGFPPPKNGTVSPGGMESFGPGDLDLDLELAKQLLVKFRDPNCKAFRNLPSHVKQHIAWRLRKHARTEEERR